MATQTTHLDEQLVHRAMEYLLPTTLQIHNDNVSEDPTISWKETNDVLGEWEDRDACSSEFLAEMDDDRSLFAEMESDERRRYCATAMRLIRDMGHNRAAAIVDRWQS